MNRTARLLAALALAMGLLAAGPLPATAADPGTLAGIVTDSASHAVVAGVTLTGNGGSYTAVTDSLGHYEFTGIVESTIWVSVGGVGTGYDQLSQFGVAVPDSAHDIAITATPTGPGSVSGHVYDRDTGDPLQNASVSLMKSDFLHPFFRSTQTDADGAFSFTALPLDTFTLSASKGTTGPGTPTWDTSTATIKLTAGAEAKTRDFSLKPTPIGSGTITTTFLDEASSPVVGLSVNITRAGGSGGANGATDGTGTFVGAHLLAGTYFVTFYDAGGSQQINQSLPYSSSIVILEGPSTAKAVTYTLHPYVTGDGSVRGVLTDRTTGLPVVGASISLAAQVAGVRLNSVTTDSNGAWHVENLPYGRYSVSIDTSRTVTQYERELAAPDLVIPSSARVERADSVRSLPAGGSVLSGQIRDQATHLGVGGATVSLNRTLGGLTPPSVTADASGKYAFPPLPEGQYTMRVTAGGYEGTKTDVDIDADPQRLSVSLVATAATTTLPTGTGRLTGTVVDSFGDPITTANVNVNVSGAYRTTLVDSDGHFELEDLPLAALSVSVYASVFGGAGYAPYTTSVDLAAHPTLDLPVALAPEAKISGTVSAAGTLPGGLYVMALDATTGALINQVNVDVATGLYTLGGLPAGGIVLQFVSPTSSSESPSAITNAPAFWVSGTPTGSPTRAGASVVTLVAGDALPAHDITLDVSGAITGTVEVATPDGTAPLAPGKGIVVSVYEHQGSDWVELTYASVKVSSYNSGSFVIAGLAPGDYRLKYVDRWSGSRALVTRYSGGSATLAGASSIAVTRGAITDAGTMALSAVRPSADPDALDLNDLDSDSLSDLQGQIETSPNVTAGQTITVAVGEEYAGDWVAAWANSTPVRASNWAQVSADGTITATIPAGLVGSHRIVVQDADQQALGWAPLSVTPAPATSPSPTTPPSNPQSQSNPQSPSNAGAKPGATSPPSATSSSRPTPAPSASPEAPATAAPDATDTAAVASDDSQPVNWLLIIAILIGVLVTIGVVAGIIGARSRRA